MEKTELFKYLWLNRFSAYVVYRECFDVDTCPLIDGAIAHKVAIFFIEADAENYCNYRNSMMQKYNSDAVELIRDWDTIKTLYTSDITIDPATAAIEFAINNSTEEPISFLRCWFEGDFEAIRNEWPEAPKEIFIGADPLLDGPTGEANEL